MTQLQRMAALAIATLLLAAPAARAGDFFIDGQAGHARLSDTGYDDDRTDAVQIGGGYRWGVGPAGIGIEVGGGRLGDLQDDYAGTYAYGTYTERYRLKTRYGFVGANARIKPPLVPVYFIGRLGYMGYASESEYRYAGNDVDYGVSTYDESDDDSGGGVYYGVGVGTTILPLLDVGLMYGGYSYSSIHWDGDEYVRDGDVRHARTLTLGVEYRF
jgi:hypothetical protein